MRIQFKFIFKIVLGLVLMCVLFITVTQGNNLNETDIEEVKFEDIELSNEVERLPEKKALFEVKEGELVKPVFKEKQIEAKTVEVEEIELKEIKVKQSHRYKERYPSRKRPKSIWNKKTTNVRGMFADTIATGIGDILTVIVDANTTMSNELTTSTTKDATIASQVNQFLFPTTASGFGTHKGSLPGTDITSTGNAYDGTGEIGNTLTLNSKLSVTVIDVLPNGNLVFEGIRTIAFSDEIEYAVLRGVVRPADITASNTVSSSKIADAQIEFVKEGSISAAQKKGWFLRFYDAISPF